MQYEILGITGSIFVSFFTFFQYIKHKFKYPLYLKNIMFSFSIFGSIMLIIYGKINNIYPTLITNTVLLVAVILNFIESNITSKCEIKKNPPNTVTL